MKAGKRGRAAEPLSLPVTATRQAHGPARFAAIPDLPPSGHPALPLFGRHLGGRRTRRLSVSKRTEWHRITIFGDGRPDSAELREGHEGSGSPSRTHYEMDRLAGTHWPRHADLKPITDLPSRVKQTESEDAKGSAVATASTARERRSPAAQAAGF